MCRTLGDNRQNSVMWCHSWCSLSTYRTGYTCRQSTTQDIQYIWCFSTDWLCSSQPDCRWFSDQPEQRGIASSSTTVSVTSCLASRSTGLNWCVHRPAPDDIYPGQNDIAFFPESIHTYTHISQLHSTIQAYSSPDLLLWPTKYFQTIITMDMQGKPIGNSTGGTKVRSSPSVFVLLSAII